MNFGRPQAIARIAGNGPWDGIHGTVSFFRRGINVLVVADVFGLPDGGSCGDKVFGLHIHEGVSCAGAGEGYPETKGHYNPNSCAHPHHAGDLPPLFECSGHAFLAVLTDRIRIADVIGRAVVIHSNPDDFTSQPAGNSGEKIACGIIRAM